MLPLEKKNVNNQKRKKMFKEPDAKCIYLIIHSTPPSFPLSSTASGEKQRVGGGGRAGVGGKKRREKKKEAKVVVVVTPALCSRYHTNNTHTHTHSSLTLTHTASTLRSCRHVPRTTPTCPGPMTGVKAKVQSKKKKKKRR